MRQILQPSLRLYVLFHLAVENTVQKNIDLADN